MGQDQSDDVWRHQILFDIRSEVSCDDRNFRKEDLRNSRKQEFDEEHREPLASQEEALSLSVEEDDPSVNT